MINSFKKSSKKKHVQFCSVPSTFWKEQKAMKLRYLHIFRKQTAAQKLFKQFPEEPSH